MGKATPIADDTLFIESIYKEYHGLMFSVAGRFGLNTADQEDVVSSVMIWLLDNTNTVREIETEKRQYYIAKAVISKSIDFLRKQKAQQKKPLDGLLDTAQPGISLEDRVVLRTELLNVFNTVMSLPEKESLCIRLKYLSGCTNTEIASATGLSESSVNQYIMRARKHIREALYGNEENGNER